MRRLLITDYNIYKFLFRYERLPVGERILNEYSSGTDLLAEVHRGGLTLLANFEMRFVVSEEFTSKIGIL